MAGKVDQYLRGKALVDAYKAEFGTQSMVGFSRGKDSITTSIVLRDAGIEMTPVFFYVVPGLEFIEESLAYYERVLFGGKRVIQYPEAAFFKWMNDGLYQTPWTFEAVRAANFANAGYKQWWAIVDEWVKVDEDMDPRSLAAVGIRAADSPFRRINVARTGPIRRGVGNWLPIWDYLLADVERTIETAGVSLPIDYKIFGRSFSGGLDARYMVPLKRHLPHDFDKVREFFPLVDLVVWRYERFVEGATCR